MRWVCLTYHDVVAGRPGDGGGPERFAVSRDGFAAMLDSVAAGGYEGCSLERALARPGTQRVAITFDDGTAGQFTQAFPELESRGMTATFFVTVDWVGRPGFVTWEQLRSMKAAGMSVQSHTKSHPHMSELGRERLWEELTASKRVLDHELGQETTQLALPGGDAPRREFRPLLAEAGFQVVACSRWGVNGDEGVGGSRSWIKRCTAPRRPSPELARKIISGDPRLTLARSSREAALNGVRSLLGANRYHRWRRRVLDTLRGPARVD